MCVGWPYLGLQYIVEAGGLRSEAQMPYCAGAGLGTHTGRGVPRMIHVYIFIPLEERAIPRVYRRLLVAHVDGGCLPCMPEGYSHKFCGDYDDDDQIPLFCDERGVGVGVVSWRN